jgi:hypothetical protein
VRSAVIPDWQQCRWIIVQPRPEGFVSRHRFVFLFGALLFFYVLAPVLHQVRDALHPALPPLFEGALVVFVLAAAVTTVSQLRTRLLFVLLLGLPIFALLIVDIFIQSDALTVVQILLQGAFFGYVIWKMFRAILASHRVTINTVCASLCIYLLLGVLWALAYSLVGVWDPAALTWTVSTRQPPRIWRFGKGDAAVLYFSFVTLATLGYGDIVPTSPFTRMLATLEAITGQLYLAVLVARLVGMHIAESLDQKHV